MSELILWGILPAVAAVGAIAVSLHAVHRNISAIQLGLSVLVIGISLFSLIVLKRIFVDGAWPSALPHMAIAASCGLVALQRWLGRRASGYSVV